MIDMSGFISLLSPCLSVLLHRVNRKNYLMWNNSPWLLNGKSELYLWEILGNLAAQGSWHQSKSFDSYLMLPVKSNLLKYGERLERRQKSCSRRNIAIARVNLHWGSSTLIPACLIWKGWQSLPPTPQPPNAASHNKYLQHIICT